MMLAFLIDRTEQRCCALFRAAPVKAGRQRYFWEEIRSFFLRFRIPDRDTLHLSIECPGIGPELKCNDTF